MWIKVIMWIKYEVSFDLYCAIIFLHIGCRMNASSHLNRKFESETAKWNNSMTPQKLILEH